MQNKKSNDVSNKSSAASTSQHQRPWYKSQILVVSLFFIAFASWFISIPIIDNMSLDPSLVILKSDGCAYLRYHNIGTSPYPSDGACAAEVQFRPSIFGNGGTIILEDRDLKIYEGQIIAVEPIKDRPLTTRQIRLWAWLAFETLIMIGTLVWMGITLL